MHPGPKWIFIAIIVVSALTLLGLGLTLVFYICKRSAKVFCRLARNRGKTTEAPVLYKAVSVYTVDKDDVFTEEEISTQFAELDETNTVILTGIKQQQSQSKQPQPSCTKITRFYYIISRVILLNKLTCLVLLVRKSINTFISH